MDIIPHCTAGVKPRGGGKSAKMRGGAGENFVRADGRKGAGGPDGGREGLAAGGGS